jgi:HNH endonuclease
VRLAVKERRWHLPNPPNSYGQTNTNWKGGKRMQGGYTYVLAPINHPIRGLAKGKRRYIAEHRLVVEQHIKRYLEPFETVHHRNGIKTDNRIENLEIVTHARSAGSVVCPHCRKAFQIY